MTHDRLCPASRKEILNPFDCTFCEVIFKVRADERASRESFRP